MKGNEGRLFFWRATCLLLFSSMAFLKMHFSQGSEANVDQGNTIFFFAPRARIATGHVYSTLVDINI